MAWQDPDSYTAGQVLTAASLNKISGSLNAIVDAWTSYTPALTNLTLGTGGTVNGYYVQAGKFVWVDIVAVLGSSGFSVSNNPQFGLPNSTTFAAHYTTNVSTVGSALVVDQVALARYQGYVRVQSSSAVAVGLANVSGAYVATSGVTSTVPFTWGAADEFHLHFWYESA